MVIRSGTREIYKKPTSGNIIKFSDGNKRIKGIFYFLMITFFLIEFAFMCLASDYKRRINKSITQKEIDDITNNLRNKYKETYKSTEFARSHIESYQNEHIGTYQKLVRDNFHSCPETYTGLFITRNNFNDDILDKNVKFKVHPSPGDGSCMYHSILYAIWPKLIKKDDFYKKFINHNEYELFNDDLVKYYKDIVIEAVDKYKSYYDIPYKKAIGIVYYLRLIVATRWHNICEKGGDEARGLAVYSRFGDDEMKIYSLPALNYKIWSTHDEVRVIARWLEINVWEFLTRKDNGVDENTVGHPLVRAEYDKKDRIILWLNINHFMILTVDE